jgi:diguanylate cyclase (GGDEF)-like protein
MHTSLGITIIVMGMLGMAVALVSGQVYRGHMVEGQRSALAEQLRLRINDLRRELDLQVRALVVTVPTDTHFVRALETRNAAVLQARLNELARHPAVVAGELHLSKAYAYNRDASLVVASPTAPGGAEFARMPCESLRALAVRQRETDATKSVAGICLAGRHPYYAVIQPVGELQQGGHLLVLLDLLPSLTAVEGSMATPLKLSYSDGSVVYQSPRWPVSGSAGQQLQGEYALNAYTANKATLNLVASKDMQALYERLDQTEYFVMLAAAVVTLFAALLALFILQKTAVGPLQALARQLWRVRQDKEQLGQKVTVGGNAEVVELGAGFNDMTTQLKELYESLERMAFTDLLTQLPNRTLFLDRLNQAILSARRENRTLALCIMDLDRFKDINDTLGHQVGDQLLQQVAQRLASKVRESDTVARLGGDEFAILLPAVNAKYAGMAARMLLQALRTPFLVEEQSLDIGASIGIALYPDHGVDANILIQRADVAMYSAKHSHTGHAFYETRLDEHNPSRLALMGELRRAVEHEQFVLHYQPVVSLTSGRVMRIEALVRWQHPQNGLMMPDSFVPLLEQTGLIRGLTPWVLNEALQFCQTLHASGLLVAVALNLSVRDLQDPFLVDTISEQLAAHQVEPEWIELEITESAVMENPERAGEVLQRLAAMGLKLAIDDFGTGYSSLAYLKKLPVSTLKVDKSFVINMAHDENDAAIVHTSIDLAHNLGLTLIAEGVENEDILTRLTGLGCDAAQGHYLSRPLPAEEVTAWLRNSFWGLNGNAGAGAAARPWQH